MHSKILKTGTKQRYAHKNWQFHIATDRASEKLQKKVKFQSFYRAKFVKKWPITREIRSANFTEK